MEPFSSTLGLSLRKNRKRTIEVAAADQRATRCVQFKPTSFVVPAPGNEYIHVTMDKIQLEDPKSVQL